MHFAVMGLHGAEGSGTESAALKVTPVGWLLAVGFQVLSEVNEVLAAAGRGQEGLEQMGDPGTPILASWGPGPPLTCSHNSHI